MSRLGDLAKLAAEALADGRDPFDHAFLVEHNVKADECLDLSDRIASAILAFEAMTPTEQAIALAKSALPSGMAELFEAQVRLHETRKKLERP